MHYPFPHCGQLHCKRSIAPPLNSGRLHWRRSIAPAMRNAGDSLRTPGCQPQTRQSSLAQTRLLDDAGFYPTFPDWQSATGHLSSLTSSIRVFLPYRASYAVLSSSLRLTLSSDSRTAAFAMRTPTGNEGPFKKGVTPIVSIHCGRRLHCPPPPSCGRLHRKRSIASAMRNLPDRARTPGCKQLVRQPCLAQTNNPGISGYHPHFATFPPFGLPGSCALSHAKIASHGEEVP